MPASTHVANNSATQTVLRQFPTTPAPLLSLSRPRADQAVTT